MPIRPATPADAPALGELVVASWLAAHRDQVPEEAWLARQERWTPQVSADGWARLLGTGEESHVLLVAEEDGALRGQVLVRFDDGTAHLLSLYVAHDRLRRGTGRGLLVAAARAAAARGCTRMRVGVLTANTPARAFYEALGGVVVGARTFRMGPGDTVTVPPRAAHTFTAPEPGCRFLAFSLEAADAEVRHLPVHDLSDEEIRTAFGVLHQSLAEGERDRFVRAMTQPQAVNDADMCWMTKRLYAQIVDLKDEHVRAVLARAVVMR